MNVILLEPVGSLGDAGEMVSVKPGYARNWLVPQGLALPATASNQRELDARLQQRAKQLSARKADALRLQELLADAAVEIRVKAGEDRIYGSVGNRDVADALKQAYDVDVDRRKIELQEPIKTLGEYTLPYRPHPEVTIDLKVVGVAEGCSSPRDPPEGAGPSAPPLLRAAHRRPPSPRRRGTAYGSAVRAVALDADEVGGAAHAERHAGGDHESPAGLDEAGRVEDPRRHLDHLVRRVDLVAPVRDDAPGDR